MLKPAKQPHFCMLQHTIYHIICNYDRISALFANLVSNTIMYEMLFRRFIGNADTHAFLRFPLNYVPGVCIDYIPHLFIAHFQFNSDPPEAE